MAKKGGKTPERKEKCVPTLLIRHKVTDFEAWRIAFHEDSGTRSANGSQREFFYRNSIDPDEVWILLEWDDLFRARLFVRSDDLNEALIRAGVTDHPDYWYLEEG
jgi:hypothetical protein